MIQRAELIVDIAAIVNNWRLLKAQSSSADCAAVVKANAYGLGVAPIATALAAAGCTRFFVATLQEGLELRGVLPKAEIFIFHGIGAGEEQHFLNARLSPVLNSLAQLACWQNIASLSKAEAVLHVDTGMCRLGVSDVEAMALSPDTLKAAKVEWLISHLACAGAPEHPKNAEQLARFRRVRVHLPELKASLANSSGVFLGPDFHFDLLRPGCSLYGISPNNSLPNPMHQVATLTAPVIQVRTLHKAETVGYEATYAAPAGTHLATIACGYADGMLRSLSGHFSVWAGDVRLPVVGRVSMDMIIADISGLTREQRAALTHVELIGPHQTVDDVAAMAGTIGYEIFTRLGSRIHRHYLGVDNQGLIG